MRSSIVIDQAATTSCRSMRWPRHFGSLYVLVILALLCGRPDLAFAQYPGFSSDAEPESVSAVADDAPSGGSDNDASANSGASSSANAGASSRNGFSQLVPNLFKSSSHSSVALRP